MKQATEMAWLQPNHHEKHRYNLEVRACAREVLTALIARVPANQKIDAKQIAAEALEIAAEQVATFIDNKLI